MRYSVFVILLLAASCQKTVSTDRTPPNLEAISASRVTTEPQSGFPAGSYPLEESQIVEFINDENEGELRAHSWAIWQAITSQSNQNCAQNSTNGQQCMPIFQTWFNSHEVFDIGSNIKNSQRESNDFGSPRQFLPNLEVTEHTASFNRYSPKLADRIWEGKLDEAATIDTTINAEPSDPGTDKEAIIVKTVFTFIDSQKPTRLPYWSGDGDTHTSNPNLPTPETWKHSIVIDPSMKSSGPLSCSDGKVGLDAFYHVRLRQEDVDAFRKYYCHAISLPTVTEEQIKALNQIYDDVKVGNFAILVAMHVTTGEYRNWTWQTHWWSCDSKSENLRDRPMSLPTPWSNYAMATSYYMVGNKTNTVLKGRFNPYLETGQSGKVGDTIWYGKETNCMSCHQVARYPDPVNSPSRFIPYGDVKQNSELNSSLFKDTANLHFMWSLNRACDAKCLELRQYFATVPQSAAASCAKIESTRR